MYTFPKIKNIDDVLPAIKDCPEFGILRRGEYTVIQYNVVMADTFPEVKTEFDALRRECRGITFDKNGDILSRKYHKFFNVNEREETQIHRIDFSKPHYVLEKLDGSMITPLVLNDRVFWATKRGVTDYSDQVQGFVDSNKHYEKFAVDMFVSGVTPIFEWCSRQNRIVIDYPEDRLVLTGIRENYSGNYYSYLALVDFAEKYKIDYVKTVDLHFKHLLDHTRGLEGKEGYVVRFEQGGHMVKIKSEWYTNIHSAKDELYFEKNIIRRIVDGNMDDVKPFLLESDLKRLEEYEKNFSAGLHLTLSEYCGIVESILGKFISDKRAFATSPEFKLVPRILNSYIFGAMEGKYEHNKNELENFLLRYISRSINSSNKVLELNYLWKGVKWNE